MLNQREIFGNILLFLNCVAAFAAIAVVGAWGANIINIGDVMRVVSYFGAGLDMRIGIVVAAIAFGVVDAVFFAKRLIYGRYGSHFLLRTEGGDVAVSFSAIESSLERAARQLPEVQGVRVSVKRQKREGAPLTIRVSYSTWENNVIRDVVRKLQTTLQMRCEQLVGTDVTPSFEMYLAKIVARDSKKRSSDHDFAGTLDPHFTGPRYPIDQNED